jgi:hypothetical protein
VPHRYLSTRKKIAVAAQMVNATCRRGTASKVHASMNWFGMARITGFCVIFFLLTTWVFHSLSPTMSQKHLSGHHRIHSMNWQELAAGKRQQINDKIAKKWVLDSNIIDKAQSLRSLAGTFIEDLLDHETVKITALDNVDLVDALSTGSLTSVQVVSAFCKRAVYAHQLV